MGIYEFVADKDGLVFENDFYPIYIKIGECVESSVDIMQPAIRFLDRRS